MKPLRLTKQVVYKKDEWEDEIDNTVNRMADNIQKTVVSLATLAMFITTYFLFHNSSMGDNLKIIGRQTARHTTHDTIEQNKTPFGFSPEGYVEGNLINAVMDEILKDTSLGQIEKDMGIVLPDEYKTLADTLNNTDIIGSRGYHEAAINGELQELLFHDLGIPWTTCEDNENCQTDTPVCNDCDSLSGMIIPCDMFQAKFHDFCRCNEPMADPVLINPT